MQSVTSNAVASSEEYFPKITNEVGTYIKATNVVLRPRNKGLATLNILDEDKTGLSVDFDFTNSLVRVYSIENGVTQGQKDINMQSV